jgi:hypothetical protein
VDDELPLHAASRARAVAAMMAAAVRRHRESRHGVGLMLAIHTLGRVTSALPAMSHGCHVGTSTVWRLPVTVALPAFAKTITQLNRGWPGSGLDQKLRAFAGRVADPRRIRVNAGYIELRLAIAAGRGVGPVRHPMGAHAPGEIQHAGQNLPRLALSRPEQLRAGSLGRLPPRTGDP